jgi:hypothetical protein
MPTYVSLWCWKQASPSPHPVQMGGGDQKAQEELASRSPCSFSAVGGATDDGVRVIIYYVSKQ